VKLIFDGKRRNSPEDSIDDPSCEWWVEARNQRDNDKNEFTRISKKNMREESSEVQFYSSAEILWLGISEKKSKVRKGDNQQSDNRLRHVGAIDGGKVG